MKTNSFFKKQIKHLFWTVFILTLGTSYFMGQTILFTETFDEANGATTGMSAEGINWSSVCPDCDAGDYFEVLNGAFEGNDTNGPGSWVTDPISIPAGTEYISITMDYDGTKGGGYAGDGNLETSDECGGCGGTVEDALGFGCFNCWDFVAFEVDEGGGDITSDILLGEPGTADEGSLCQAINVSGSTEFVLTIFLSMWASNEYMSFDNVTITAYTPTEAAAAGISAEGDCPACALEIGPPSVVCNGTPYNGPDIDGVTVTIPYSGAGVGSEVLNMNGFTNTGDDPITTASGNIIFTATEGDSYNITLTNNICTPQIFAASGTIDSDLCPASCVMTIETVDAVCANDGTTNYDLDITFTHANPLGTPAEVNINVTDGGTSLTGFPDNNVATTGVSQTESYTGVADGDATTGVTVTIEDVNGVSGGAGMFTLDFDANNTGYNLSVAEFSDGDSDYFGVIPANITVNPGITFTGTSGNFFGAQDIDGSGASSTQTITIPDIDISCLTAPIAFSIDLAEDDASDGSEDWDSSGDYVHITYSIDGGAAQNLLWVENDGTTFNTSPQIDTNFDGVGDGAIITDTWQTFNASIPSTGNILTIVIEINLNAADEDIAIDNIIVDNCIASTVCDATTTFTEPDCSCPELPTAEADGPYTICDGTSITFTDAFVGGAATTGTWSITAGPNTSSAQLSDTNPTATPEAVTFTPTMAGTYTLLLTANVPAPYTCPATSDMVTITVETQEVASLVYSPDAVCNDGANLSPDITGSNPTTGTFEGSLGLAIDMNTGVIDVANTDPGTYTVTYTTSTNTCRATAMDEVTIHPLPTISGTAVVCEGGTTTLSGTNTPDATTPWMSSNTTVATVDNSGVVTGVAAGTADITYTDSNGCQDTETVTVNANPMISGTTDVCIGATTTLSGTNTPDATTPWMSSNTTVATVDNGGIVTGVAARHSRHYLYR